MSFYPSITLRIGFAIGVLIGLVLLPVVFIVYAGLALRAYRHSS